MKNNVIKDDDIYIIEKEKEAYEFIKASHDVIEQRRFRFLLILFFLLVVVVLRVIFGPIYIKNIFGYPSSNNRYFDVKVNGESLKNISYKLQHNLPIIPFFLYFRSSYEDSLLYVNEPSSGFYELYGNMIIVDIDSYECYYGKDRIKCKYFNDIKPEKKKIKLKNMEIYRISNDYGQVYKGKFTSDISKYLGKKGSYNLIVDCEFNHTKCKIIFDIKKMNDTTN